MRRSISIFVLLLLVAPQTVSFGLAAGAPAVPACCRAGGAHHCMGMPGAAPGDGLRALAPSCPYRHIILPTVTARLQAPAAVATPAAAHTEIAWLRASAPAAPLLPGSSSRAPPARSSLL